MVKVDIVRAIQLETSLQFGEAEKLVNDMLEMIKEKLERYVQILNNIEDDQDKFMWIMDFGKNNPGLHDQYKLKCYPREELDEDMIGNLLIISKPAEIEQMQNEEGLNEVADALDIDFLQFDDLEIDYLEEDESQFATGLDIDFLEQNFLADILAQINKELAKAMRSEFDKQKSVDGIFLGKHPETGVIILDEDPEWVWIREDASGSYIELRLDKEYGYVLNIIQGEFEQYDFELGGIENAITIQQIN